MSMTPPPLLLEPLPAEIRSARLVTIAGAQVEQYVAIVARVTGEAPLVAPMSGRACVAFDFVLEREPPAGSPEREVYRPVRRLEARPFTIEDDSGRALVDPRGAFVRLAHDEIKGQLRSGHLADRALGAELERKWPRMRLIGHEGALVPGATVLVVGVVQGGAPSEAVFRQSATPLRRIAGGPRHPALVGNHRLDLQSARHGWRPHDDWSDWLP